MQVKLLRAIQEKVIRKVGGNDEVVRRRAHHRRDEQGPERPRRRRAASGRTSSTASTSSRSRLPPLRSRTEDVAPLTTHFITKICKEQKIPEKKISIEAMRLLEAYPWPGNVRELENTLERTVALEAGPVINASSLPGDDRPRRAHAACPTSRAFPRRASTSRPTSRPSASGSCARRSTAAAASRRRPPSSSTCPSAPSATTPRSTTSCTRKRCTSEDEAAARRRNRQA